MLSITLRTCARAALFFPAACAGVLAQEEWTPRNLLAQGNTLNAVAWKEGKFVTVGDGGTVLTSADGLNWTSRSAATDYPLTTVLWTGNEWLSLGFQRINPLIPSDPPQLSYVRATSSDAYAWPALKGPGAALSLAQGSPAIGAPLVSAGYSFINTVLPYFQRGTIFKSMDGGSHWTTPYTDTVFYGSLNAVVWTGTRFVAAGYGGEVVVSPDGDQWTSVVSGASQSLNGLGWTGSQLVAVGDGGTILTSPDGLAWTARVSGTNQNLNAAVWTGAKWVAVGDHGTILVSTDGIAWESKASGTTLGLNSVASMDSSLGGNPIGNFLAVVGEKGIILTSPASPTSVIGVPRKGAGFAVNLNGSRLSAVLPASMKGPVRAALYGLGGRKLFEVNESAGPRFTIDVGHLAAGSYVLELRNAGERHTQSFSFP